MASYRSQTGDPQYRGPAVISDGNTEHTHNIEVHTTIGEHRANSAWHIIIKDRLDYEFSSPLGKHVVVELPSGIRCAGSLIDPKLLKGVGPPPC